MARITIEDCLRQVPNRFVLVNMVAQRVRQIREGSEYLVSSPKNEDVVVSLREIAAGKLTLKPEADEVEAEAVKGMAAIEEVESLMAEKQDTKAGIEDQEEDAGTDLEKEEE
ncbi:MAG: DNA-directed RNA polymerase subunit omega [Desulfobacterales bacterium]|nr:DNA-directed RNA polymerase subunit omega [Desulfobacterales bacterium]